MRLRIAPDGTIRALWDDGIGWSSLGRVYVRRASHVEFCHRKQLWYVRAGRPGTRIRRVLQWILHRPFGEILHWASSRDEALAWERTHYQPGGRGWPTVQPA
jgi:hypothetical protein